MTSDTVDKQALKVLKNIRSKQYELFANVFGDGQATSNSLEFWDGIPKYFFSDKVLEQLKDEGKEKDPFAKEYYLNTKDDKGQTVKEYYRVIIRPATIAISDGSFEHVFPGKNEQTMEEAFKLLFKEQNHGYHDPTPTGYGTWVAFSFPLLQEKLKLLKSTMSAAQMTQCINVMQNTRIEVFKRAHESDPKPISVYSENLLPTYISLSRAEYRADTDGMQMVRLPTAITSAINTVGYRQFNSERLGQATSQLTKYLYALLINKYTYAANEPGNNYNFTYLFVEQHSNLLVSGRAGDNRRAFIASLNELVGMNVLLSFEAESDKQGNKIIDVKYTVVAHPTFVKEQKMANARRKETKKVLNTSAGQLPLVDRL